MTKTIALWTVIGVLFFGTMMVAFGAGMVFQREVLADEQAGSTESTQVFDRAWETVIDNYVDESAINEDQMLEAAIEGMLDTLGDQGHTRYLTAEETELDRQQSRGVYYGVGVEVLEREEGLVVTRTFPGSAAREEGVLPGDVIVGVDGEDVTGMPLGDIIQLIRGPEGTHVEVTMLRGEENERITFDLERREIEISAVTWTMLENNVAFLKLEQFSDRAGDDLSRALEEAQNEGATAVVLDLRGNPGGLVREARQVASLFIPDDAPIYISQSRAGGEETHRAERAAVHIGDIPLVVLVDNGSASASEIVSGAIKSQASDATLVGETTVGTGTVLRQFELGDGSTIWLGVELWLTPDGQMIREQGISPDVTVPLAEEQLPFNPPFDEPAPSIDELNDDQLEFAIDLLTGSASTLPFANAAPGTPW